jgi:hypothetical protein
MHGWISFDHHRSRSGGLAFPLLRRHAESHVDLNVFDRNTNFPPCIPEICWRAEGRLVIADDDRQLVIVSNNIRRAHPRLSPAFGWGAALVKGGAAGCSPR